MPENNNIKIYSAADIERYHKGQMSPEEMHAIEKAALDDTFLADAMEGYNQEAINSEADISFLKEKLKQRLATGKVVELKSNRSSVWWKAAASIIIIVGAGMLVYQLAINKGNNNVVKVQESEQEKPVYTKPAADSSRTATKITNDVAKTDNSLRQKELKNKEPLKTEKELAKEDKSDTINSLSVASGVAASPEINKDTSAFIPSFPAKDLARNESPDVALQQKSKKADNEADGVFALNKPSAKSRQSEYLHTNVFHGQVLDANNNALPFANITSTRDKIGTYADAKGNFILTSADSVLNVQIKSVGYEIGEVFLRNDLPKNQVVLQEDTKNLNEIVIINKKSNSNRKKLGDKVAEDPEPEDGWENYDTYIVNNLNIPDEIQTKPPGLREVQISFNVNKNGEPVNIKVEKSLCKKCDTEAIRLLKEGPKWKGRGKKSRGSVTVPF